MSALTLLVIAVGWTALSLLLAGSWVLMLEIGRRLGSAPAPVLRPKR